MDGYNADHRLLAGFLAGDLGPAEARRWDEHLLACEQCWRAVREDRAGRQAAALLRRPAPAGLADRGEFALEVAAAGRPAGAGGCAGRVWRGQGGWGGWACTASTAVRRNSWALRSRGPNSPRWRGGCRWADARFGGRHTLGVPPKRARQPRAPDSPPMRP